MAVTRSVVCKHPGCEDTDTKTYRIRLPGRNNDRRVELCVAHEGPLVDMASWSEDTPRHEQPRPAKKVASRPGRHVNERALLETLPLVESEGEG